MKLPLRILLPCVLTALAAPGVVQAQLKINADTLYSYGTHGTGIPHKMITVTGAVGAVDWIVTGLPTGVSARLDPNQVFLQSAAGSPVNMAGSMVTVTAKTATQQAQVSFRVRVVPEPQVATAVADGVLGKPYSFQLTATEGDGTYVWDWFSYYTLNSIGLNLSPSGVISGTPTQSGLGYPFCVTVKTWGGDVATFKCLKINIQKTPYTIVSDAQRPSGRVGVPYTDRLSVAESSPPEYWTVTAGGLPPGLALSRDGYISGTPTVAGSYSFTITAAVGDYDPGSKAFTIYIAPPPLQITSGAQRPTADAGTPYSDVLQSNNPASWSVVGGALPPGLALSAGGTVSGTPTTAGSYAYTASATASGETQSAQFTVVVNPALEVSTALLPDGMRGTAYSQSLFATGGAGSYTWSITKGTLPPGLTFSSGGVLSGTPTTIGTFTFSAQVVAGASRKERELSVTIRDSGVITSTSTRPAGVVDIAYEDQLTSSFTVAPAWSLSAGALPAGLSLASDGWIRGTPTAAGTSRFTVRATGPGASDSRELEITIHPELLLTSTEVPAGTLGTAYSHALLATGGSGPYTWSISKGALPSGLSLSPGGVLSGTPGAVGTFTFSVQVVGGASRKERELSIAIRDSGAITSTSARPAGMVGVVYEDQLASSFTVAPAWSLLAGALPAGLSLASDGWIRGTPTAAGISRFTVRAAGTGASDSRELEVTIHPALLVSSAANRPNARVGVAYTDTLRAAGGAGGYAWSMASGALPTGLSLSASGVVTGVPTTEGTSTFVARVRSGSFSSTQTVSITVTPAAAITSGRTRPNSLVGRAFADSLRAEGFPGAVSWTLLEGALPAGLNLGSTSGIVSGVPSAAGRYTATIRASGGSVSDSIRVEYLVHPAATISTDSVLRPGFVGISYGDTLRTSGGPGGSYTWNVGAGSLPQGLSLSSAGVVTGTPTAEGNHSVVVELRGMIQASGSPEVLTSKTLSLRIYPALSAVLDSVRPAGSATRAYTDTLRVAGGTGSYQWAVSEGSLPPGLTISQAGVVGGTPTTPGAYRLRMIVTSGPVSLSLPLRYTVAEAPIEAANVAKALLGDPSALTPAEVEYMDTRGNRNGRLDVGDVRAWLRGKGQIPAALRPFVTPDSPSN